MATKRKAKETLSILNQKINRQPVNHLDATPNADYPLRILRAYRENCNVCFVGTAKQPLNALFTEINKCQVQRAKILDEAIKKLGG